MKASWIWTEAGLKKLGGIIRRSREEAGLDQRTAATLVSKISGMNMSHNAIGSSERASVKPDYNTLAAIAAAGFVKNNGRLLTIFDFIAIASEMDTMNPLTELIENHLSQNNLTLTDFSKASGVSLGDLQLILCGEQETKDRRYQTNLRLICGHLVNPTTGFRFPTLEELLDYCGMQKDVVSGRFKQSHLVENAN